MGSTQPSLPMLRDWLRAAMAIAAELDLDKYCADVAAAREAGVRAAGDRRRRASKTSGCGGRPSCCASTPSGSSEANARDLAAAPGYGLTDAEIDRLRLTPKRIEAIADGLEDVADLPDPIGEVIAVDDPAQRPADRQSPRAAGRRVFHLRVAAERDGRRRGDLREERQRGDPPRRQGSDSFQPGDRRAAGRGGRRSRPAGRRRATGEHDRPRGGGPVSRDAASTSTWQFRAAAKA